MRNVTRYVLAVLLSVTVAAGICSAKNSAGHVRWQLNQDELATVSSCSLAVKKALVPQLLHAYAQGDAAVRERAEAALHQVGRGSRSAVVDAAARRFRRVSGEDAAIQKRLFGLIDALSAPRQFPMGVLKKALRGSEPALRREALWTVSQMGVSADGVTPELFSLIRAGSPTTRRHALEALRTVGVGEDSVPRLCRLLHSGDFALRRFAVDALAELGKKAQPAIPELVSIATTSGKALQTDIRRALERIKTQNEAPVVKGTAVSCAEGGSTEVELSFAAWDSMPGSLDVSIAEGPSHGTVERRSQGRFVYHSSRGYAGQDSFTCSVSDDEGASSLARATVRIQPDTQAPELEEVASGGRPGQLELIFSEPVSPAGAEDVSNYEIDSGVDIVRAQLGEYGMTVTLTVSPLSEQEDYVLRVQDVADCSAAKNRIAEVRKRLTYYDGKSMGPVVVAEDVEKSRPKPAQKKQDGAGDRASLSGPNPMGPVAPYARKVENGGSAGSAAPFLAAGWVQEAEQAGRSDGSDIQTK